VIAMVVNAQLTLDHVGNPLRCPQFRPVSLRHRPFGQETNEPVFLPRGQPGWPAGRRLGFQPVLPEGLERIAPAENTARVATYAPGDLVKGEVLLEEPNDTAPTFFQRFRRTMRSHRDTPFLRMSPLYCITYAEVNKKWKYHTIKSLLSGSGLPQLISLLHR